MKTLRAGVVGVGKMGEYHVGILSEISNVELTSIVDVAEERASVIAGQYNIPNYYTRHKDLFGKVDVVVVSVPTSYHYSIAKDFLLSGINVLLEKPCANDLDHAKDLFDIAAKNNLTLHIGHVERFNGAVQEIQKIVSKPIFVECRRMGPFSNRIKDDGVVLDIMIHDIDTVLNLVKSKVVKINVTGASVFSMKDDIVNAQLKFKNDCIANIVASRASQNKVRTLEITQEDSYVLLDYTEQEIYVHRKTSSEHVMTKDALRYKQESHVERIFVHKDNPLKLEIKHFLDCAANGSPRNVAVDKELYSLEIALEILNQFNRQN